MKKLISVSVLCAMIMTSSGYVFAAESQLPLNPSFENTAFGQDNVAELWNSFHGGYERVSLGDAPDGSHVIKVSNTNTSGFAGAYQYVPVGTGSGDYLDPAQPIAITSQIKYENVVENSGNIFGAGLYIEAHHTDGSWSYHNEARFGTSDWGEIVLTLQPGTSPIDGVYIVPVVGKTTGMAYFDQITIVNTDAPQPGPDPEPNPEPEPQPGPDTLNNGGFEEIGSTPNEAYDWHVFGDGYTRNQSTYRSGGASMRVRNVSRGLAGAYQRIDFNQTSLKPVSITGYVKGSSILNTAGQFGASLYVEIYLQDGSVRYWNSLANAGTFDWRYIGFSTGTLGLTSPISHILVVPSLNNAVGTAYFDDITVTEYEPHQSAVTIMFDDGEDNVYTQAKPVMDVYGFMGTSAVISSEIGNSNDGFMDVGQMLDLQNAGWEIVSHAVHHEDITLKSRSRIKKEFEQSKKAFEALGVIVKNFAYPFGAYIYPIRSGDKNYINALGAEFYNSTRAYELGDNPQGAFPQEIKVRSVVESTTVSDIQNWITEAQENGRWVVLTFHSIAQTGDDAYHTDPAVFAEMMSAIQESGVDVVTYQQGLERFAVQPE